MHLFDEDIALNSETPGGFTTKVSSNWSINGHPNGGYLLAIVTNAMLRKSDKRAAPILTVNYIARSSPGESAECRVENIATSRQFCRLQARLVQAGQEKLRAIATFTDPADAAFCTLERYESPPPAVAEKDRCIAIPVMPKYSLYDNMDVRLDPAFAGWMENRFAEKSEHRGWIAFKEERPYDICALALVVDSFPPAVFASQGMTAWVPTVELTVSVRNLPASRWLKCVFRTRFISCGVLEEDGQVWDENDELVAVSRQIALFRPANG
ncbi:MAG: thioesterase family protein [Thermodesulfobacteriota bacterium]